MSCEGAKARNALGVSPLASGQSHVRLSVW